MKTLDKINYADRGNFEWKVLISFLLLLLLFILFIVNKVSLFLPDFALHNFFVMKSFSLDG